MEKPRKKSRAPRKSDTKDTKSKKARKTQRQNETPRHKVKMRHQGHKVKSDTKDTK